MLLAAALVVAGLIPAGASAAQTPAQKLFRDKLLADPGVSKDVKTRLRKGGFVDPDIVFRDLTGEGRSDAVVAVHSGGTAGRVALFIFSSGTGDDLKIVYRNQRLYRARVRVASTSVFYAVPDYDAGDELCCPAHLRETELVWRADKKRFGVASRRTIDRAKS